MDYSHEILMPTTEFLKRVRTKIASYQPPKDKSIFDTSQEVDYELIDIHEEHQKIRIEKPALFVKVDRTNTAGFITIHFQPHENKTILKVTFETSSMNFLGYIFLGLLISFGYLFPLFSRVYGSL